MLANKASRPYLLGKYRQTNAKQMMKSTKFSQRLLAEYIQQSVSQRCTRRRVKKY
jgi:hypothetical protein